METGGRTAVSPRRVAVIGSGIAGLSCAWALAETCAVTLYEQDNRPGGHSNTVEVEADRAAGPVAVDTGFLVYNEPAYPNLTALFAHLGIETTATDMSFAVSLDQGRLEYSGSSLAGLFAQKRNLLRPRFWHMLADLRRFYRQAPGALASLDERLSLGDWLDQNRFGAALQRDHLLPMAAAIWSCPLGSVRDYPAAAFIRFCNNHGLLRIAGRPVWRTVAGGSRCYVARLLGEIAGARGSTIRLQCGVTSVRPRPEGVALRDRSGRVELFDEVVLACHAPEARALIEGGSPWLQAALAGFRTTRNLAVLHADPSLMPQRRAVWSSWNLIGGSTGEAAAGDGSPPCVSYWMNRLQRLPTERALFVTLNPPWPPAPATLLHAEAYAHPLFDQATQAVQRAVWTLQGQQRLWFAGAWLGAGFHEDGLQAGLAVAEALGGVRRPWQVAQEGARMPGPALSRPDRPELVVA